MDTSLISTLCFLCGSPAKTSENPRLGFTYYRCRQCGEVHLSHDFVDTCEARGDHLLRQQVAALVAEWNLEGKPQLIITARDTEKNLANSRVVIIPYKKLLEKYPTASAQEIYDRILKNLSILLGECKSDKMVVFDRYTPVGIFFASGETQFDIINSIVSRILEMEKLGYVDFKLGNLSFVDARQDIMDVTIGLSIAKKGWDRLVEVEHAPAPYQTLQAYVSMWNDKSRSLVFDKGIRPAIEAAHAPDYTVTAHRPTIGPFDPEACELIFAEIRKSIYLVADLTGYPPAVFHEAGYAQGYGIPVIWLIDRHFRNKTGIVSGAKPRRFNYVIYDSPSDLATKLRTRIAEMTTVQMAQRW